MYKPLRVTIDTQLRLVQCLGVCLLVLGPYLERSNTYHCLRTGNITPRLPSGLAIKARHGLVQSRLLEDSFCSLFPCFCAPISVLP